MVFPWASPMSHSDDLPTTCVLGQVRQEASKCPDVVIAANIENVKMNSLQTYFVPAEASLKAPAGLEPSIQWQIKQILEFAKLRWVLRVEKLENFGMRWE